MSGTVAQLKELKELLDGGVLTQEEFDAQKTVILEKYKITQVAPAPVVGQPAQPAMMQPDQFLQAAGAGRLDEVNQYLEGGGDVINGVPLPLEPYWSDEWVKAMIPRGCL